MPMRPLAGRLVVRPDPVIGVTPGGIVLPDRAKPKPDTGTVVKAGLTRTLDGRLLPASVADGDRVLYASYAGEAKEKDEQGRDVILIRYDDVLAVLGEG